MESLRVYYVERQRLVAADLQSEQEYLSGLDERHNLYQHRPGIVRGLRLRVDSAQQYWVEPGIAIDSSGRELLLTERAPITIEDANKCADVWLTYCRQPLRLRQLGRSPCSSGTFQRWTEIPRVLVVTVEKIENPTPPPDEKNSDPEPPVEGAVFLGRINCQDPRRLVYTALHGKEVKDPGNRALMQVGPRAALESESFVLSVGDAADKLTKRIAIDRRGNNVFYGTLELLGHHESLVIAVPRSTTFLMVEPVRPGETVQVKLGAIESPDKVELTLRLEDSAKKKPSKELKFNPANENRHKELEDFNKHKLARIRVLTELPPLRGRTIQPQSLRLEQQSALTSWRGTLELDDWPEQDEAKDDLHNEQEKKYGCYDSPTGGSAEESVEPTGLSFLPVSEPLKGAPLPRIYSAVVKSGDRTIEQLRLDLGEKKDVDFTERLTIGAWPGDEKKFTALAINGTCRFSLTSENEKEKIKSLPNKLVSMKVGGLIEQTIKPNPTNPVFANLLIAAWMYGLRSSALATTNITVTLQKPPDLLLIETQKAWKYDVRIENKEANPAQAKLVLETLGSALPKPITTEVEIPGKQSVDIPVEHSPGEVPAGDLDIKIMVSGEVNKVPWAKDAPKLRIPVVETPQADLSDVPELVPALSAWEHVLKVKNPALRNMTLLEVKRTEGHFVESVLAAPVDLPAQQSKEFGPFPHPDGLTKAGKRLDVSLFVKYRWENGPEGTITSETKTIRTEPQLSIKIQNPDELEVMTPWEFSLGIENRSAKPIKLKLLEQRLKSADFPDTSFIPIAGLPAEPLDSGDIIELNDIPGTEVPKTTNAVTLEIRAEYEHDDRIWHPPSFETSIVVNDKP